MIELGFPACNYLFAIHTEQISWPPSPNLLLPQTRPGSLPNLPQGQRTSPSSTRWAKHAFAVKAETPSELTKSKSDPHVQGVLGLYGMLEEKESEAHETCEWSEYCL